MQDYFEVESFATSKQYSVTCSKIMLTLKLYGKLVMVQKPKPTAEAQCRYFSIYQTGIRVGASPWAMTTSAKQSLWGKMTY